MKKDIAISVIIAAAVVIVAIAGLKAYQADLAKNSASKACTEEAKICPDGSAVGRTGPNCEFAACPAAGASGETKAKLSEAEARVIAEKICVKGGEILAAGYYNENSKTWWFDANLNATRPGCNPACVVSEDTNLAEINWRCTGLIIMPKTSAEEIQKLFALKYPKYSETVNVSIDQETADHARGGVNFAAGAPGGLFLAAKIDGAWQIVFDGNGEIPCNLVKYGFPGSMLKDCF